VRDPATGLMAIDLYPTPVVAGTPIYVRYQTDQQNTGTGGNFLYATVPDTYKRHFARLLYAMALEQNLNYFARNTMTSAGILRGQSSPASLERTINRTRQSVYRQLGGAVPVGMQTF